MSGVIYFKTKYGATERYAQMLSKETGFEVKDIKKKPKPGLENVAVITCSIIMGKLIARKWIAKVWPKLSGKKVLLALVCTSEEGSDEWNKALDKSLTPQIVQGVRIFSLPGAVDYDKISPMIAKMVKMGMEADETMDDEKKKKWVAGFDDVKLENLEPVLEYIKSL